MKHKKKICIITSSYPQNENDSKNAGVFIKDFAILLSDNYDVSILAPSCGNAKNNDQRINVSFFPWLKSDLGLSSLNPKNPLHLIKLVSVIISGLYHTTIFLRKNKFDYCLAMWAIPSGFFALVGKVFFKIPYFTWSLGSDIWKVKNYPIGNFILKRVFKNASKLFANGYRLKNDVETISKKDCTYLSASRLLNTTLQELTYSKFDSKKINFIFLGRYHQNKGVDLLIESVQLLKKDEKERILIHIFGGGPLEKKIKSMVNKFNLDSTIIVNGYLNSDQVYSYFSKSDFMILPSRIEGIPVVLSDAMQSNLPVIISDVGDMGRLAREFKIGYIVQPNAMSISDGLRLAIYSDENQLKDFNLGINSLKNYLDLKTSVKTFVDNIQSFQNSESS